MELVSQTLEVQLAHVLELQPENESLFLPGWARLEHRTRRLECH
jgi:hypothetical protein